jgi:hypothetical protein
MIAVAVALIASMLASLELAKAGLSGVFWVMGVNRRED